MVVATIQTVRISVVIGLVPAGYHLAGTTRLDQGTILVVGVYLTQALPAGTFSLKGVKIT